MSKIKNNIRRLRKKANMTQADLAYAVHVNQCAVSFWESGKTDPRYDKLPLIAKVLKCSVSELINEVD